MEYTRFERMVFAIDDLPRWARALICMIGMCLAACVIGGILMGLVIGVGWILMMIFGEENVVGGFIAVAALVFIYAAIYSEMDDDKPR